MLLRDPETQIHQVSVPPTQHRIYHNLSIIQYSAFTYGSTSEKKLGMWYMIHVNNLFETNQTPLQRLHPVQSLCPTSIMSDSVASFEGKQSFLTWPYNCCSGTLFNKTSPDASLAVSKTCLNLTSWKIYCNKISDPKQQTETSRSYTKKNNIQYWYTVSIP